MGLLVLFSAFTSSRLATLLVSNDSSCRDSEENSMDDLSSSTLACDSDGDILVDDRPDSKIQSTKSRTICCWDIDLFLITGSRAGYFDGGEQADGRRWIDSVAENE
jgi:hypothetical protein